MGGGLWAPEKGAGLKILSLKDLPLAGAKLIEYARFIDSRGYFTEVWRREDFAALAEALGFGGLEFVQVNESRSAPSVMRGLHFQVDPPLGKLIRVLYGRTVDMALDVRAGSATFGRVMLVELSLDPEADKAQWLWLPPGLAHGNFYLETSAIEYFCDAVYNPAGEVGISPLDPDLDFGGCPPRLVEAYKRLAAEGPILSPRDRGGLSLAEWRRDPRSLLVR
jgi:dTDP-4-dehydrorhamnose 3,5-epimerase